MAVSCAARPTSHNPCYRPGSATAGSRCAAVSRRRGGRKRKETAMAFVVVANLDDMEVGDTMLVDELREPICLIRLDDYDVRAIHNICTHQFQPLHEGRVEDDDTLVCASHASR